MSAFHAILRLRFGRALIPVAVALATSCASVPKTTASQGGAQAAAPGAAPANPERDLAAARDKLEIAKLQLGLAEKHAETARMRKEKELELARGEMAQFDEGDAPNRLAKSKLELARRRDALTEQKEELAQLEMMYEQQDLADKTREIVLQRGKRRVERAADELAIEERESAALEARILPRERAKLALEIDVKTRELEESKGETEATLLEKRVALRAAEGELHAAEAKVEGAKAKP